MHPVHCALAELPMCNQCFQTRTDSMSLFDHDDTMQHLILLGILINSAHGADMLALAHEQLAAIPYHKDFKHFSRAPWAKNKEAGHCGPSRC